MAQKMGVQTCVFSFSTTQIIIISPSFFSGSSFMGNKFWKIEGLGGGLGEIPFKFL
jgi:hypothetical protein